MAIAYRSSANSGFLASTTTSTNVTKPSGLAVGDLMYAVAYRQGTIDTPTFPSGFTFVEDITPSGGNQINKLWLYQKIADSADVAASSFTFSHAGGVSTNAWLVGLVAFSGANQSTPTQSQIDGESQFTTTVSATITGISGTNILFAFAATADNVGVTSFVSSPSRTWNNIFTGTTTIGDDSTVSFRYSSTDTTTSNTGLTVTFAGVGPRNGLIMTSVVEAGLGPTNVKTFDGVTQATGIKTYSGIAVASVKSVNGVS